MDARTTHHRHLSSGLMAAILFVAIVLISGAFLVGVPSAASAAGDDATTAATENSSNDQDSSTEASTPSPEASASSSHATTAATEASSDDAKASAAKEASTDAGGASETSAKDAGSADVPGVDKLPLRSKAAKATATKVIPASYTITGTKTLTGRDLAADEFSFKITKAGVWQVTPASGLADKLQSDTVPMAEKLSLAVSAGTYTAASSQPRPRPATATNDADGTISFAPMTFSASAVGSGATHRHLGTIFSYIITEKAPVTNEGQAASGSATDYAGSSVYEGVTYDNTTKHLFLYAYEDADVQTPQIKVINLGVVSTDGSSLSGSSEGSNADNITFKNVFDGAHLDGFDGAVFLDDEAIDEGEFAFEVYEVDENGNEVDAQDVACGSTEGGSIGAPVNIIKNATFTHEGTYYFAVSQIDPSYYSDDESDEGYEDSDEGYDDGYGDSDEGYDDSDEGYDDAEEDADSVDGEGEDEIELDDGTLVKLDRTSYIVSVQVSRGDSGLEAKVAAISKQSGENEKWVAAKSVDPSVIQWHNAIVDDRQDGSDEGDDGDEDWWDEGYDDGYGEGYDEGEAAAHAATRAKAHKSTVPTKVIKAVQDHRKAAADASAQAQNAKGTQQSTETVMAAYSSGAAQSADSGADAPANGVFIGFSILLLIAACVATGFAIHYRRQVRR